MRYEGTRPSRRDPQIDVYAFAMGIDELKALLAVLEHYIRNMPDHLETSQLKQRLGEMRRSLREAKLYNRLSKRNIGNGKQYTEGTEPLEMQEVQTEDTPLPIHNN